MSKNKNMSNNNKRNGANKPKTPNNNGTRGNSGNRGNSNSNRGNKNSGNRYDEATKTSPDEKTSTAINEASYYFDSPEMMRQLCNISFNEFLGASFNIGDPDFNEKIPTVVSTKL